MNRFAGRIVIGLALLVANGEPARSQSKIELETFLRQNIELNQDQMAALGSGEAIAKTLPPRKPDEVFLFGAVYIRAEPERYVQLARNVERRRRLPNYLALGVLSQPPQLAYLQGFAFDGNDIEALKKCQPGNCQIQLPASSIEELHRSIDWSASDVDERLNAFLQRAALKGIVAYQRTGNEALGIYNDKPDPIEVQRQFAWLLSYQTVLPAVLPDLYNYLLRYPKVRPANIEDAFYWSKVKFGLKPTLRVVHLVIMKGSPEAQIAYAVAEKQLYASHYFETALDLSYCVRPDDPKQTGFYLITVLASEQAGLTGVKGSIVRKTAVGRSVSSLHDALARMRTTLEGNQ
jgi:hypothetical protein